VSDLLKAALAALEAMEHSVPTGTISLDDWYGTQHRLRAALAQPEPTEDCWLNGGKCIDGCKGRPHCANNDTTAAGQPTADGPTLPKPRVLDHLGFSAGTYTANQMLAFRDAAVAQERERCAKVCESVNNHDNPMTAQDCAAAIRKG